MNNHPMNCDCNYCVEIKKRILMHDKLINKIDRLRTEKNSYKKALKKAGIETIKINLETEAMKVKREGRY